MKEEDYWQSIEDFCDLCEEVLGNNFVSFILIGSLSTGDFVPAWSDVDSFLIVKDDSQDTVEKRDSITKTITEKYPYYQTDRGSWFCAMITTKDYFVNPEKITNVLNLWDVKHYGKVVRGENFLDEIELPPLDPEWLDNHTKWMMDFLKKEKGASPFWKTKNSIGFILCSARNMLLKKGLYFKRYEDICAEFGILYPKEAQIVGKAGNLRQNWLELKDAEIDVDGLYKNALEFLEWCGRND